MATLQERFGFQDADLKTPAHDAIMIWLEENSDSVILPFAKRISSIPARDSLMVKARQQLDENYRKDEAVPPIPDDMTFSRELQIKWEHPIKNGNYTVGFIDMLVWVIDRCPTLWIPSSRSDPAYWSMWKDDETKIGIEVKSKIPSLGELMRQVQLYRSYMLRTSFIVASPDSRFASLIRKQGVGFIEVPTEVVA